MAYGDPVAVPDYTDPRLRPRLVQRVASPDQQNADASLGALMDEQRRGLSTYGGPVPVGQETTMPPSGSPASLPAASQPQRPLSLKQKIGNVARGAAGGALAGLSDYEASGGDIRLEEQQRQQRAASELEKQRIGGETGLEQMREAYQRPEQQAQIAQQGATTEETGARTEQQRLASKILQRRLEMMSQEGAGGNISDITPDEQALLASAYATGDPKTIESAVGRIYSRRSIEGMTGPAYNEYDPNAPGGATRVQENRAGKVMGKQPGVVVPGLLPKSTTSTQLVPTTGGGMASVSKPSTTSVVLPGAPSAVAGGGNALRAPGTAPTGGGTLRSRVAGAAGGARPVMNADGTPLQPRLPAQEERAQDTATMVIGQLPRIKGELQSLRADLGPLGGRVMELGQAVGTTNPNYIKVRTDTDAAVSAFSVIHFGARGNWQWLQDFRNNMDAGHLNFPDLVAGWSVLEQWLRAYSTYGEQGVIQRGGVDKVSGVNAPGAAGAQR